MTEKQEQEIREALKIDGPKVLDEFLSYVVEQVIIMLKEKINNDFKASFGIDQNDK